MIYIDSCSRTPFYEQIKEQVMWLVQQEIYQPNEQLPSIRKLSKQLELNVNTIKRAFNELEAMGVIYSLPGRGFFVSDNAFGNKKIKSEAAEYLKTAMFSAKAKGLDFNEMKKLLLEVFEEDGLEKPNE